MFFSTIRWPALVALVVAGVLSVSPAYASYHVIYSFCSLANCADGYGPNVGVVMDKKGNLYGTTDGGGADGRGTIFELVKKEHKWEEKVLYSFCSQANCTDGATPNGELILDTSGNLYGISVERGGHDNGNIFELLPNARKTKWTLRVLHDFCEVTSPQCADGTFALAGLSYSGESTGALYDGESPLYGTATNGGTQGGGLVYQLNRVRRKWKETAVYNFCSEPGCADGDAPQARVVVDASSNIWGTAATGGPSGGGVVFRLTPNSGAWTEKVLYSFCSLANCADGSFPSSQPLLDSEGNVFGTAMYKGADSERCLDGSDCGVIFKIAVDGTESTLHQFCTVEACPDGAGPQGSLTMDNAGNLFGTTVGVDGPGTLFKFDGSLEVLNTFCSQQNCLDGYEPFSVKLVSNRFGTMFGTARAGGPGGGGVVFEWKP